MSEVRPGYKQTEVGVIPEEWEAEKLAKYAVFRTGPFGSALHKSDYTADGVPIINPMHIIEGRIIPNRTVTITDDTVKRLADFCLESDDIIIARRGEMGRCALVLAENKGWLCGTGSLIIRCKKDLYPEFLQRVLSSPTAIRSIEAASVGMTMINLNQNVLGNLHVQLPPYAEQSAIAEVLSDTDALIQGLDQLIAKKRNIKQGAMQGILTGKQRLPGFNEEWKEKQLCEVGLFRSGNGFPLTAQGMGDVEQTPFYKVSDMNNSGNEIYMILANNYVAENTMKLIGAQNFQPNTIIFAKIGAAVFLERKRILSRESCIDNNLMGFIVNNDKFDYRYIHHLFLTIKLAKMVSTTALPSLSGKEIGELHFFLPPTLAEQIAIATVLSDMDAEIAALEQKRDKYKAIKQGMMQELLTGKTRLV